MQRGVEWGDVRPPASIPVDELLRHAGFVRDLARELCHDAATADDLAQDVWVRTLAHPPHTHDSPRGWFATIARRLVANRRRGDQRRRAREHGREAPTAPLTPEAVLAAEQTRERLVHAVLALAEPYRQVLLLRFWEGLEPRDIAARMQVPGPTVRTHLARGLERLRAQLDAEHGGDRSQWLAALAPWLPARAPVVATATSLLLMKKLVVASLLVAVAAFTWWSLWPASGPLAPNDQRNVVAAVAPGASAANADAERDASLPRTAADGTLAIDVAREPRVFPATRGRAAVLGIVVDEDGLPVADAAVELAPTLGHAAPGLAIEDDRTERHRTRSGADGRFRVDGVSEGPLSVRATFDRFEAKATAIVGAADSCVVHLRLGPRKSHGDDLRVRVVDSDRRPVPDAHVQLFAWSRLQEEASARAASRRTPLAEATSDANGDVAWRGLGIGTGVVFARTRDGCIGRASFDNDWDDDPLTAKVEVAAPGALRLHFRGLDAEGLRDAVVSLHALAVTRGYATTGGRSIDVPLTSPTLLVPDVCGTYGVTLSAPFAGAGGARLRCEPMGWGERPIANSVVMTTVHAVAGRTTDATLEVVAGGTIRGRVVAAGGPVRGARVRAVLTPRNGNLPAGLVAGSTHIWHFAHAFDNGPDAPESTRETHTDGDGEYVLPGLPPGEWRIEVATPSLSLDRRMDVRVAEGETVSLHHELQRAGVLQVAAVDVHCFELVREGEREPTAVAYTLGSFATFAGLAPGRYVVGRFGADTSDPLGVGTVVAGRTTWLDLRAASVRAVIRGVVHAGADAVAGAVVYTMSSTTTARDGTFRLDCGYRPDFRSQGMLDVSIGSSYWSFKPPGSYPAAALDVDLQLGAHHVDLELHDPDRCVRPTAGEFHLKVAPANPGPASSPTSFSGKLRIRSPVTRIGPMPEGRLFGDFELEDGSTVSFRSAVPRAEPLRLALPGRGTLRIRVLRAPMTLINVSVTTWLGSGDAPADFDNADGGFATSSVYTDENNLAVAQVLAGEILVRLAYDSAKQVAPVRVRLEPGTETTVDLVFP